MVFKATKDFKTRKTRIYFEVIYLTFFGALQGLSGVLWVLQLAIRCGGCDD